MIKKDALGQAEHEQVVILSLRIGEKVVYKDISLSEAVSWTD